MENISEVPVIVPAYNAYEVFGIPPVNFMVRQTGDLSNNLHVFLNRKRRMCGRRLVYCVEQNAK
jgi:hypothetical protein